MKTICMILMFLTVGLSAADKTEMPRTVTEVFDRSVSANERAVLIMAREMPEDKYDFVPVNGEFKGVRTFAQMVKHIAVDQYVDAAALLKEKTPIDRGVQMNGPDSIRTKAEILKFLEDAFAYMHKAMHTVNQKNLMEMVKFDGVEIPRLTIVTAAISHPMDHYGQMVEYLRMNGIDPQAQQ